jgi:hypothetical protein
MADTSTLYPTITNFVISHILSSTTTSSTQSQSRGVAARPLIRLIENEFFGQRSKVQASQDDLGSLSQVDISESGNRKFVVDLLKGLTAEKILKGTTLEVGGYGFKMHPGWQEKQWEKDMEVEMDLYHEDPDETEEETELPSGEEEEEENDVLCVEKSYGDDSAEIGDDSGTGDEARLWNEAVDAERKSACMWSYN